MAHLYERLAPLVADWRSGDYEHLDYPAMAEIMEWAGETEGGDLRFLRLPQLRALETYWYLRLVQRTPHIFELYSKLFAGSRPELLEALGVPDAAFKKADYDTDALWKSIQSDDDFVRSFRLESLRETLTLDYPSYILALAMGAGKTVLIGAVIATEFAMAQEYQDGTFVENALVFAPGKTILSALRELSDVPYERILPPRMQKRFAASMKLTFTRDGERDIPVVRGSSFNVIVTNTEKIRIRSETVRKTDLAQLRIPGKGIDDARREVANLRLQAIASLPHLGIFSDEAHHTYGQSLEKGLKKVRMTVDYLSENTNLICVVNTTGTPYFKRQPLKDVVVWYSLSAGIADGILKDVSGNIRSYQLSDDTESYVRHVILDFFGEYRDARLPNGAPAKLAMYFPQTDDLRRLRPAIDEALLAVGLPQTSALVNTSDRTLTAQADIDAFERLNDPAAPHRLILLVNKGTEGWNCPSLFGSALARRLTSSNNFVLQAASRCLRQVPGNTKKARIYLSADNYGILDRQLAETYGETIQDLERRTRERETLRLVLRKKDVPPLVVRKVNQTVVRRDGADQPLHLEKPETAERHLTERTYAFGALLLGRKVLQQIEDTVELSSVPAELTAYEVATAIASRYRLDVWHVYDEIRRLYGDAPVPEVHQEALAAQIEDQLLGYEVREEVTEATLAIVRPEGFHQETDDTGTSVYTAEIVYPSDKEALLARMNDWKANNKHGFGFHYDPYDFDSRPERDFFRHAVANASMRPDEIEDVYYTGGITDPAKTDFWVEYRDRLGKWRRYTPDFVIRKKPEAGEASIAKVLIVEVKAERERDDPVTGADGAKAMAMRKWETLNPDLVNYEMIFVSKDAIDYDQLRAMREFIGAQVSREGGLRIPVDRPKIEEFCRRWKIVELSFFGSALREDFGSESDVDVLVAFCDDAGWSLMDTVRMEEELSEVLGRSADLVERSAVETSHNWIRKKEILESAEPFFVAR